MYCDIAYLQIFNDEIDYKQLVPKDSDLMGKLCNDVGYKSDESFTNLLSKKYNIDLNPIYLSKDYTKGQDGWQNPSDLLECINKIFGAMEAEGNKIIGLTISGYFIYPTHIPTIKSLLTEIIVYCNEAIERGQQIRIIFDDD